MRFRILRVVAFAAPAVLAVAGAAHAQDDAYPPEVLSTAVTYCSNNDLVITADGVMPNSQVHIQVDWDNDGIIDINVNVQADSTGFVTKTYPMPDTTALFTVKVAGLDWPNAVPFDRNLPGDRTTCPDLPNTGADSFPIGKTALFVTLAGALLAVIAIRRRSRDEDSATTSV